jgi:hypothetical protein
LTNKDDFGEDKMMMILLLVGVRIYTHHPAMGFQDMYSPSNARLYLKIMIKMINTRIKPPITSIDPTN